MSRSQIPYVTESWNPIRTWASIEPMLGPVDLLAPLPGVDGGAAAILEWVVIGCESGAGRRPCEQDWILGLVRQCKHLHIPVYVKQVLIGRKVSKVPAEWPEALRVQQLPWEAR